MTLPRWVEPDPPDDDGGDTGGAGETRAEVKGWDDLSQKPVLEWTNEDWARWVDSPDLALPAPEDAPEPEPEPVPAPAPEGEGRAEAAPEWVQLLEEVAPAGAVVDPGAGAEAPVEIDEDLAPTGEWILELEEAAAAGPDDGPVIVTGTFPAVRPPAAGEAEPTPPWSEEEWAAVEEHPWWQSAPEPDPATARLVAVEPEPEAEAEVEAPVEPAPAPAPEETVVPAPLPAPVTRPPAPAKPKPKPAVYIDQTPHRVRAAFSLLGVAVVVGTVMAGLIGVMVLAISFALRRAVG